MCFSVQADLVVGLALVPVGVLTLREVRRPRELVFAALPLLFAVHQLVEALVWAGTNGDVSTTVEHAATMAYLVFAMPVLPILVPLGVLLLEPRGSRLRVAGFVVLGAAVSAYFAFVLLTEPVSVAVHPYGLEYETGVRNGGLWVTLYIVAVIGPSLLSGYSSIVAFGLLNLVGLTVVAIVYAEAFVSLWCVYAAVASVLILRHMIHRRRLPDLHRLAGRPLVPGHP